MTPSDRRDNLIAAVRLETEGRQFGLVARCRVYRGTQVVHETEGFYPFAWLRAKVWMWRHA